MKKLMSRKRKYDNKGAALVTVIVVITFISIMSTIILYTSGRNFYMKATDTQIKEGFYDGEKALEQIKAALMKDAQEAFEEAYKEGMASYAANNGINPSKYNQKFVEKFRENWDARLPKDGAGNVIKDQIGAYLGTLVDDKYVYGITYTPNSATDPSGFTASPTDGYVVLGTVSFTYTEKGYTTIISTEYKVSAPKVYQVMPDGSTEKVEKLELVDCVCYQNWTKK